TAVFYYESIEGNLHYENKLYNPVPLGYYSEIHLPTSIGIIDILNSKNNASNKDLMEYIVTKTKGKYDSFSLTGEKLTTKTKEFPNISSDLLQNNYYWLKKRYDHVYKL